MATLSQMCELPQGWLVPSHAQEVRMSKKMEWRIEKRKQHERLMAYRKREYKRMEHREKEENTLKASRRRVRLETMADDMSMLESGRKIFAICKGQRSPKKAKNSASREQAGTIGRSIVVKRFANSRLTCVCKSRIY